MVPHTMTDRSGSITYSDSAALYTACHSTDPQAQSEAYTALWQYLCRVALRVVYDQPDMDAMSQDCAQIALIRIHERLWECADPQAFYGWARRIVTNIAIDELRRRKRLTPLTDEDDHDDAPATSGLSSSAVTPAYETAVLNKIDQAELRALIEHAPISQRSARVVLGRYFDNLPDEELARVESQLAGQQVLPSHVQVTRTKDIARLRQWERLRAFLRPPEH